MTMEAFDAGRRHSPASGLKHRAGLLETLEEGTCRSRQPIKFTTKDSVIWIRSYEMKAGGWVPKALVVVPEEAEIVRIEVSTDAGHTWQPATLGPEQARWAWREWAYDWEVRERGAAVVLSRATDASDRVQPLAAGWNPWGYLWNAVDRVQLTAV